MQDNWFIFKSFSLFFRHKPGRLIFLFLITLFLGVNQGATIVLLIPLLELLNPMQSGDSSGKWTLALRSLLDRTGIELNLELILMIFAFILILVAVLTYIQTLVQSAYQQEFSYRTRKRIFKKIILSDWNFLNGKSKHNHIQILTTEIPKMTTYYYYYLGLTSKILFIIAHVTLALMISIKFTLFVVISGMLIFLLLRNHLKTAMLLGNANIQTFRKMLKHIDDFWLTVKMAKVHNTEDFYYKKFNDSNLQMLHYQQKQIKNRAFPQLLFTLSGIISLIIVVYLAYYVIKLPLASLFVLILLFARIFPQFSGLNNDLNMLVSNAGSVKMVLELDREIQDRDFEETKGSGKIFLNHQLEIRDLNFGYESNRLFTHFSESIPAKKMTGIIGRSGRGKTTLIDIITGLQHVGEQVLTVDGTALNKNDLALWRRNLGYLPQDPFFIDGTLRENLIWDSEKIMPDEKILEILKQINADHLVSDQKSGLDTFIVNYAYHFSGGERQRLALARVLLREPELLLLDEATSALDPENEARIMDCLVRLKEKVTIVFVTHRQNLHSYFDKIINLDEIHEKSEQPD